MLSLLGGFKRVGVQTDKWAYTGYRAAALYTSRDAQKIIKWTNGQSELCSRCLVVKTKKERKIICKFLRKSQTLKNKVYVF